MQEVKYCSITFTSAAYSAAESVGQVTGWWWGGTGLGRRMSVPAQGGPCTVRRITWLSASLFYACLFL
jgi:hypothetical protein